MRLVPAAKRPLPCETICGSDLVVVDIGYCYFIVNRALTRLLSRFGIPLVVVGEPVEHRGIRTPQRYQVDEAETGMQQTLPGFARMLDYVKAFVPYTEFISRPHPFRWS